MSEVTDILSALRTGRLSLEQAAERMRRVDWRHPRPAPGLGPRDPEPTVPNSFEEVVLAYSRHELTDAQYAVLLDAATGGDRDGAGGAGG
ncbi:hypothetical protein [Streptomyces sp. NPDC088725]|uniref:hypothetical protein n=1 Tax=Streptomyces sp. NPDC088725 TaxID=3365873 RepID=UPI0037F3170C